ncbi:MAG: DNA translocase FtsK 4TM domain-containing protein [Candidatus Falkowbacteria bacterium]
MPRRKKRKKYTRHYDRFEDGYGLDLSPEMKKSILIIAVVATGGISLLSLFGLAGFLGDYINSGSGLLFGWGRFLVPVLLLGFAFLLYNEDKKWVKGYNYVGLLFFILSFQSLLHIFFRDDPSEIAELGKGGGYLGLFLTKAMVSSIGFLGSLLIIFCLLAASIVLIFSSTISGLIKSEGIMGMFAIPFQAAYNRVLGRGDYEDEEGEEGEYEDEEVVEDEDVEYEEGKSDEFSSREVSNEQVEEIEEDERPAIRRSNIHINIPLSLLSDKKGKPSGANVKVCSEMIKRTMENFGIPVEMGEYSIGPTVTQYTFKPAEGVKLSRITSLSNDLALALAMHPIRIEAPIPNKALVGVEVPNKVIARVGLREVLETKQFRDRKNNMMISLGKDVAGHAWLANLAKMPHLLVAGATGSGKSVCLNSIIVSLLYQNDPDDLKFIMVDPKRVELPVYNGIPYLLTPVITDVPKTINALKWCLNEMDRRFDVLAQAGKRNIESYNGNAKDPAQGGQGRMPYIIFVIDELADLMVSAANDVEAAIIRLAQMARAVGIHLILATQRPSVDVITGLIKANIPVRIAFSVASSVDSRTILDSQGAEKLLGRGDMLFITPELSKPKRIQGAYVDDREIKKITRYIREQVGEAEYDDEIVEKHKVKGMAGVRFSDNDSDDLYGEAKDIIVNSGKASTSFLQRRLRIGYARAARLIDLLEEGGIVGPANGARPREILISKEEYAKVGKVGMAGMPLHNREESKFSANNVLGGDDEDEEEIEEDEEDYDNEENENDEEFIKSSFVPLSGTSADTEAMADKTEDEEDEGEDESEDEEDDNEEEYDNGQFFSKDLEGAEDEVIESDDKEESFFSADSADTKDKDEELTEDDDEETEVEDEDEEDEINEEDEDEDESELPPIADTSVNEAEDENNEGEESEEEEWGKLFSR